MDSSVADFFSSSLTGFSLRCLGDFLASCICTSIRTVVHASMGPPLWQLYFATPRFVAR
jgi:hypothetical protein